MPWSDYPKLIPQFSGLIQAAAEQRFGSAATVELIAAAAREAGITLAFQDYSAIASAYGQFAQNRGAKSTLADAFATSQRTGFDQSITADMIGVPPWSPNLGAFQQAQFVLVRGLYSQETPEGTSTGYFSHRYNLNEVHTVDQLMADMQAQMEQNAGGTDLSGAQLDSIVSIERSTS